MGFSDAWIAALSGREQREIKALRESFGIRPAFKMVDTCAAEFEAQTPYLLLHLRPGERGRRGQPGG